MLRFTKMQALGNDFMVLDGIHQNIDLNPDFIKKLSHRQLGIGFDQCLILEKARSEGCDFKYRIFNADGSEVGQCGNGARCMARFIHHYGFSKKELLCLETTTTVMKVHDASNFPMLELKKPQFTEFLCIPKSKASNLLHLDDHRYSFPKAAVDVGNPHLVTVFENIAAIHLAEYAAWVHKDPRITKTFNVGIMQILNPEEINLRVYERGCGETLACGSGAVAAAATAMRCDPTAKQITVHLPGGGLKVSWPKRDGPIFLSGPAEFVYEGKYWT